MSDPRYLVVAGAALTQFTIIGLLFSYGLFFGEFEAEFGWSRTVLSACSALAFFVMGLLAMVGGRLSDRFGPRRVLMATGTIYGIGFALISQVQSQWQLFLIFGTALGIGLATHDVVTLSTIARWFKARRGIMSGVIKTGTACGQIMVPPIAAALILTFGWRPALVIIGICAVILLVLAASLMRAPPEPGPGARSETHGQSFVEARRDRTFWTLCVAQFLFFPTLMTLPLHLAVHGMDLGMTKQGAAWLLSVVGAASIAGRLLMGITLDRIGGRNAYAVCLTILAASLFGFMQAEAHMALFLVTAVYGFSHGSLFVIVSPTVAEYFGMRAHGGIFGTVLFSGTIGGAIGPILTGWVYDYTGSYTPAFLTLGIAAALALALSRTLPRL